MSLFLAMLGTVLFWSGAVGATYMVLKMLGRRSLRCDSAMPAWAISLCCVAIAMFGSFLIYISGVG